MAIKRLRLSEQEIEFLGLPKKADNRHYLDPYLLNRLNEYRKSNPKKGKKPNREDKKEQRTERGDGNGKELTYKGEHPITSLEQAIEFFEIDLEKFEVVDYVANSWDVTSFKDNPNGTKRTNYQVKVKLKKREVDLGKIRRRMVEQMEHYSPLYPTIKYKKKSDPHCFLFDPSDIHIGKIARSFSTGCDFDSEVAVQRVRAGLQDLIQKSKFFNIEKVIFVTGNDILHVDRKGVTTKGTPQDTDGMWFENFFKAKDLLIEIIEILMQIAPVEVVYNPSNHDYYTGFVMLDCVKTWFRKAKNVEFNCDLKHRKYNVYGKNLIGTTHMDGAKAHELPLLMAQEAPEAWAKCRHRYIIGHHVHHNSSKDYGSVHVETLRSPSGTDDWHHKFGYQHAPKACEARIFHPENGMVAKLSSIF